MLVLRALRRSVTRWSANYLTVRNAGKRTITYTINCCQFCVRNSTRRASTGRHRWPVSKNQQMVSRCHRSTGGHSFWCFLLDRLLSRRLAFSICDDIADCFRPRPLSTFRHSTMVTTADIEVRDLPAIATKKEAVEWSILSTRQIDNLVKADHFSAPITIGQAPRWRRSDLLGWLNVSHHGLRAETLRTKQMPHRSGQHPKDICQIGVCNDDRAAAI